MGYLNLKQIQKRDFQVFFFSEPQLHNIIIISELEILNKKNPDSRYQKTCQSISRNFFFSILLILMANTKSKIFFLVKLILVWKFSSPLCITWLLKKTSYISKPASYLVDVYPWCVFQKFKFMQANSVWCHKFFIRDLISWLHNFFPLLLLTMMFWRKYLS